MWEVKWRKFFKEEVTPVPTYKLHKVKTENRPFDLAAWRPLVTLTKAISGSYRDKSLI